MLNPRAHDLPLLLRHRRITARLTTALLFGVLACSSPLSGQVRSEEELEALRALGYISHPSETAKQRAAKLTGLTLNVPQHVAPGFTLITAIPEAEAILVDAEGQTVQTWQDEHSESWTRALLLEDGDLFVMGRIHEDRKKASRAARGKGAGAQDPMDGKPWFPIGGQYLARYSWDGTLKWRRGAIVHHDMKVDDDGRILTLGLSGRKVDGLWIEDHSIVTLSQEGELEDEYSLFDLLSSDPTLFELPRTTDHPQALTSKGKLDLLHSNAIERMPFPALIERGGIYCKTCVLVTVRHQNLVAVVDLKRETLLWVWGPDKLQFPHEGRWLENGNILVFDNGSTSRGYSRIIEVEPAAGNIVWKYIAKRPAKFFSAGRGTSQALPNGNVLIASSNQGMVFEVTRESQPVWRYFVRGENGKLLTVRAAKYPPSWVTPHLEKSKKTPPTNP